jgi:hypothetical protein
VRRARRGTAGPARPDSAMSLPVSQRRALVQIEKTLADDHPSLGPLFAVFTSLTNSDGIPATERVTGRPWQRRRHPWRRPQRPWRRMLPGVVTVVGLAVATGVLLILSLTLPVPRMCASGAVTSGAAQARSVPGGRQPACTTQQNPTQQNKPINTSQNGLAH